VLVRSRSLARVCRKCSRRDLASRSCIIMVPHSGYNWSPESTLEVKFSVGLFSRWSLDGTLTLVSAISCAKDE
jgi:hypothetical protein